MNERYIEQRVEELDFYKAQLAALAKEELLDVANGLWFITSSMMSGVNPSLLLALIEECKQHPHICDADKAAQMIRRIRDIVTEDKKKKAERN